MSDDAVAVSAAVVTVLAAVAAHRGRSPRHRLTVHAAGVGTDGFVTRTGRGVLLRIALRRGGTDVVGSLLDGWSANLRAGLPADLALRGAFAESPAVASVFRRSAAGTVVGADVSELLVLDGASLSASPDRRAVAAIAACWSVSNTHGGRLADAFDRVADSLRAERVHVAHVRAQLAGPRATARLLAGLPLLGLLMATGLGLDPLHALVADRFGRLALVSGLLLDGAGLLWTARIARVAERAA